MDMINSVQQFVFIYDNINSVTMTEIFSILNHSLHFMHVEARGPSQ